jgi:hypothetical protein
MDKEKLVMSLAIREKVFVISYFSNIFAHPLWGLL